MYSYCICRCVHRYAAYMGTKHAKKIKILISLSCQMLNSEESRGSNRNKEERLQDTVF